MNTPTKPFNPMTPQSNACLPRVSVVEGQTPGPTSPPPTNVTTMPMPAMQQYTSLQSNTVTYPTLQQQLVPQQPMMPMPLAFHGVPSQGYTFQGRQNASSMTFQRSTSSPPVYVDPVIPPPTVEYKEYTVRHPPIPVSERRYVNIPEEYEYEYDDYHQPRRYTPLYDEYDQVRGYNDYEEYHLRSPVRRRGSETAEWRRRWEERLREEEYARDMERQRWEMRRWEEQRRSRALSTHSHAPHSARGPNRSPLRSPTRSPVRNPTGSSPARRILGSSPLRSRQYSANHPNPRTRSVPPCSARQWF
mmetsp:Transcript_27794/g.50159  ORF Transcript_27794/g.50159 Transcript_27794/m.50159 type:complete len:303 (-) Transcript_27794:478-1386(-)